MKKFVSICFLLLLSFDAWGAATKFSKAEEERSVRKLLERIGRKSPTRELVDFFISKLPELRGLPSKNARTARATKLLKDYTAEKKGEAKARAAEAARLRAEREAAAAAVDRGGADGPVDAGGDLASLASSEEVDDPDERARREALALEEAIALRELARAERAQRVEAEESARRQIGNITAAQRIGKAWRERTQRGVMRDLGGAARERVREARAQRETAVAERAEAVAAREEAEAQRELAQTAQQEAEAQRAAAEAERAEAVAAREEAEAQRGLALAAQATAEGERDALIRAVYGLGATDGITAGQRDRALERARISRQLREELIRRDQDPVNCKFRSYARGANTDTELQVLQNALDALLVAAPEPRTCFPLGRGPWAIQGQIHRDFLAPPAAAGAAAAE